MKLVIVDYGMANLRSVEKAFAAVGVEATISGDPAEIASADKLVLPGVGAFRDAIGRLRELNLDLAIVEQVKLGKPLLGICLGLQLLFSRSLEGGEYTGLELLPGDVVGFTPQPGLKIPHMGWNSLQLTDSDNPLFAGIGANPAVYFVHGYFAQPAEKGDIAATSDYPTPFCAAIRRGSLFAVQFHPEKSQDVGLKMLKNFCDTPPK